MPVYKYRSIDEMPGVPRPGDPELYRTIQSIWDSGRRMSTRRFRPGVRKFHSIEEMDRAQEADAQQAAEGRRLASQPKA